MSAGEVLPIRKPSVANELLLAAQLENVHDELKYDETSNTTSTEKKWMHMCSPQCDLSDEAKLAALLEDEVLWEKRYQRKRDIAGDHPLALFTRMKYQTRGKLLLALFLLTVVHLIQIGAMYNLTGLSNYLITDKIAVMLERGDWATNNQVLLAAKIDPSTFPDKLHGYFNTSEIVLANGGVMAQHGFCLTSTGYLETMFNIASGLFLVYMFVFADLWRVIFATTITRNYPQDPHFKLMLGGIMWLILLNSVILAWLGVESGFSVVTSAGEFSSVLFNSLANFLILSLDDEVLPLLRFILEENGKMDEEGWMGRKQLDLLTHGAQYYKPGYGEHWIKTLTSAPSPLLRLVALVNIPITLGILIAPLGFVIYTAVNTYVVC